MVKRKTFFSAMVVFLTTISFPLIASSDVIEYETSTGVTLYLNEGQVNNFIESNKKYLHNLRGCVKENISFYNPFFSTTDSYQIMGRNRQSECVVEYNHADLTKYRCALNKYQIEDLTKAVNNKFEKMKDIEFLSSEELAVYNSELCIKESKNIISGQASKKELEKAVKENPNIANILMISKTH